MDQETTDICVTCGKVLPDAVETIRSPIFGEITSRRCYCVECEFLVIFSRNRLVSRPPYQVPARRPTREGKAPQSWLDQHRERVEKERAIR